MRTKEPPSQNAGALLASLTIAGSQAAVLLFGAISTVVIARAVGPSGRGGVTLLQALSSLTASLALLGMPTLIVRRDTLGELRRVLIPAVLVACVVGFLISATLGVVFVLASPSAFQEGGISLPVLLSVALNTFVLVALEAVAAHRQYEQRFSYLASLRLWWAVTSLLAVIIVTRFGAGASGIYLAIVAANCLNAIIVLGSISRELRPRLTLLGRSVRAQSRVTRMRTLTVSAWANREIRAAFGSHVALTLLLLIYRADVLLLGALSTASAVGIYAVAYVLAEIPWLLANGYAVTLLPKLAARRSDGQFFIAMRDSLLAAGAGLVVLILFGQHIIQVLLGAKFSESYGVLVWLAPGILAFVPFKMATTRLIAEGTPWALTSVCLFLLVVNVVANLILCPMYAAKGCAIASSITYVLAGILILPALKRRKLQNGLA
jgi:O-antigen/teichoic acid export membrane protein